MGIGQFFQEAPDILGKTTGSFSNAIPILIIIMLLIGVLYWLRSLQRAGRTEIRIYGRP